MTKHLSKEDQQVVADEAAAEKVYQEGQDKAAKDVAADSSQLPVQTQQLIKDSK